MNIYQKLKESGHNTDGLASPLKIDPPNKKKLQVVNKREIGHAVASGLPFGAVAALGSKKSTTPGSKKSITTGSKKNITTVKKGDRERATMEKIDKKTGKRVSKDVSFTETPHDLM